MSQILLVEDDSDSQTIMSIALERVGNHTVRVCEDGDEVLRCVRSGWADAVIMDIRLVRSKVRGEPVDGIGLAKLLKADRETRAVPILLVTAHAMRGDADRFLAESKADDYISKPITDLKGFVHQVTRLIERGNSRSRRH